MTRLPLVLLILLAGCASGSLGTLPTVADPAHAATVVVIRLYGFVGSGATVPITLDGVEVCQLGVDEHIAMAVPAGERIVGLRTYDPGAWTRIHATQTIQAEPGRTYYFHATVYRIERTTDADGREMISKTTPLQDNAWQGRGWSERAPVR